MVLSLAALFVALTFTQAQMPPSDTGITTYTPMRATIKRAIKQMRTPRPVLDAAPDLRVFIKQEGPQVHDVGRALASYGHLQVAIGQSAASAVGVPVYQPLDRTDANDFHFSMSYKFEF